MSGVAVSGSPEFRELASNDLLMEEIATRTRGRVLGTFDMQGADLFSRENLERRAAPLPIWDILLPLLLALVLVDVAIRRIAWDWQSTKVLLGAVAHRVRQFTLARKVESCANAGGAAKSARGRH